MGGVEARMGVRRTVREKRQARPKDDLSWSEVGEMAYGYLPVSYTHLTLPTNREV